MKVLAVVVALLAVLLGVHMVFEMGVAAVMVAAFAVGSRVMETGCGIVPRGVARCA